MPVMTKQLSPEQIWSVIAFLESQGGTIDLTGDDLAKATQLTPAASPGNSGGSTGGGAFARGSTDPKAIIQAAGCLACHKLDGQGQASAAALTHVGSRRDAESIPKTVLVGVLIYVSDNEQRWTTFKDPINAVLVEPRLRVVRSVLLVVVTVLVGLVAYGQVTTTVAAPPNLRSIHPAPPTEITVRGKSITLTGLENPLRAHPDSLATYLALGKSVYYRNCLPCHGDHLDGQGHFASGFNPLPANFQDNGTIAQLTESFVFWRVAK